MCTGKSKVYHFPISRCITGIYIGILIFRHPILIHINFIYSSSPPPPSSIIVVVVVTITYVLRITIIKY